MHIVSVFDASFAAYGSVLEGYDFSDILRKLKQTECPDKAVVYVPSHEGMEATATAKQLEKHFYGGMPIQIGYCNGQNNKLNCLEYHRDDEVNICATDIILLLARQEEMHNFTLNTECVKAFYVPAGTAVMLRSGTLHYAPCHVGKDTYFKVAVVLPWGTNTEMAEIKPKSREDYLLWGRNKWLMAHPDAPEAKQGAYVGLQGENWKINETSDD